MRVRVSLAEALRLTIFCLAWPTVIARLADIITFHDGIQPIHVNINVIPHGEHQSHTTFQCSSHILHATLLLERVPVFHVLGLGPEQKSSDGVAVLSAEVIRVLNLLAMLNVVLCDTQLLVLIVELRDDSEWLRGVNLEL